MKKVRKVNKILVALLFASFGHAQINQPVMGQVIESPYEKQNTDEDSKKEKSFIYDSSSPEYIGNTNTTNPLGVDESSKKNEEWLKNYKSDSADISGGKYLEYSARDLANKVYKKSNQAFSLTYVYDSYTYSDKNGYFQRTFQNEDSAHSIQTGYLLFGYNKYLYRGFADIYLKTSPGLSFNTGKGRFTDDGSLSKTRIDLWLLPVDLSLGFKLHLGRYVGLSANGGGLLVGAIQNRSDREAGDEDKNIKQVLYGYTAEGNLEISLSQIFPNWSVYLKNNSDVGDLSMVFTAKTIEASNNKSEKFQISGTSMGLGFKFELL